MRPSRPKQTERVMENQIAYFWTAGRTYLFDRMIQQYVSKSLRNKIRIMAAWLEAASDADKDEFGRIEIYENHDVLLVSENWDSFTDEEKVELNKVMEGQPWLA
jgi:hypothetical protein